MNNTPSRSSLVPRLVARQNQSTQFITHLLTRRRRAVWLTGLISGLVALLLLPGLAQAAPPAPFMPLSDKAEHIRQLYIISLTIAVVLFVLVEALLIYAIIRFGRRDIKFIPRQIHGNNTAEAIWTVIPALILVVMFFLMWNTLQAIDVPKQTAFEINVTGQQWWWSFEYPDHGGFTTGNELHIPVGEPVKINLHAADVIHSFWVPRLSGKTDAVPGRVNETWIQADEPGQYHGICTELCGSQHAKMTFMVVAESRADFDAWVKNQQAPPVEPVSDLAVRGREVFMTNACTGCHTIEGTIAQGIIGPNLTHFAGRKNIAGLVDYANTPDHVREWVSDPQSIKPLNKMPNLYVPKEDIDALVEYLTSLK